MQQLINRPTDLNAFAVEVHVLNEKWWLDLDTGKHKERSFKEIQALIVSEYTEALEGERKSLMDDKLPQYKSAAVEMADALIRILDVAGHDQLILNDFYPQYAHIPQDQDAFAVGTHVPDMIYQLCANVCGPNNFDSEDLYVSVMLADTERYCIAMGYLNVWDIVREKLEYNKVRPDHQVENRRAAGGKKW